MALERSTFTAIKANLENHNDSIEQYFRYNPVASLLSEAAAKIEELNGIRRNSKPSQRVSKKTGYAVSKVGSVPLGVDPEAQEEFKKITPIWKRSIQVTEMTIVGKK